MADFRQESPPVSTGCCGSIRYNVHVRHSLSKDTDVYATLYNTGASAPIFCWTPTISLQRRNSNGVYQTIGTRSFSGPTSGGSCRNTHHPTYKDVRKSSSLLRLRIQNPVTWNTTGFRHQ